MALDIRRQQEICEAALALESSERADFVLRETAGDAEDSARILALLGEYDSPDDILKNVIWPENDLSNQEIGEYRLLEKIGEGGMGEVYLAEQKDRYSKQRVAIKVLTRMAADSEQAARFDQEKDILAQLNHRNIPKLMFSGKHLGAPYIVMEHVAGSNILDYCDNNRLTIARRIDLFLQVLEATKFAHAELIVHRDLKPENILVDDQGQAKVLDFGIAKMLAGAAPQVSATEHFGRMPLSPGYAPPEQWLGQNVSTVVDVYALGVLLYQLLCGCMPFNDDDLERQRQNFGFVPRRRSLLDSFDELSEPEQEKIAARRSTTATQWRKALASDLQSIVFKATEPQRDRRYASVADFATDISCYQNGEMVSARAVTPVYRAARWLDRNRVPVIIGSTMLVLTGVIAVMGFTNAIQSRLEAQRTEAARQNTEQVLGILIGMLETNDPDALQPKEMTIREALIQGSERTLTDLSDAPEIQARVLSIVGTIYKELGLHNEAVRYLSAARSTLDGLVQQSPDKDSLLHVKVSVLSNYGDALIGTGDYERAGSVLNDALSLATAVHGTPSAATLNVLNSIKENLHYQSDYPRAMTAAMTAVAVAKQLGDEDFRVVAMAHNNLGAARYHVGEIPEAIEAFRLAAEFQKSRLAEHHPEYQRVQANLAGALVANGQKDDAAAIYRRIIDMSEERGSGANRTLVQAIFGLSSIELGQGRADIARGQLQKALAIHKSFKKERDREVILTRLLLSIAHADIGELERAEQVLLPAVEASLSHYPTTSMTARVTARMGTIAALAGNFDAAEEMLGHASKALSAAQRPRPHHKAAVLALDGRLHARNGAIAEAKRRLTEACEIYAARYGTQASFGSHARLWLAELDSVKTETLAAF